MHGLRLNEFQVPVPDKAATQYHDLLLLARKTLCEYDRTAGLLESLSSPEAAKSHLNSHIAKLDTANIATTDLHAGLWHFVAKVLRGGPLRASS